MNIFIIVIGYCITLGVIAAAFGKVKDDFLGIISSHSSTERLEAGKDTTKEKAERIVKERAKDPMTVNGGNAGNATTMNMTYGQTQLPDMKGIDYASVGGAAGGGIGVNAMIGAVNTIGMSQQSGAIKNLSVAGRHITGPVRQMGMVYNMKPQGTKSIQETGSTIYNNISNGRLAMNQRANQIKTSIAEGRTDVKPLGNSNNYISGDVKALKSGQGDIYTPNLQIKGISKFSSLNAQTFTAPKNVKSKIRQLNNANPLLTQNRTKLRTSTNSSTEMNNLSQEVIEEQNTLESGKRPVIIKLNTVNLLSNGNKKYFSNTENLTKTLSLQQAFGEPQNGELSNQQLVTLAAVYREAYKITPSMNNNIQNMLKQVILAEPGIKDTNVIIDAAYRAPQIWERDKKQPREVLAGLMTNKRSVQRDLQAQNINYLNNVIRRNDNLVSNQYYQEVDKAYRQDVEQRAKKNLEERANMSLEEKEKQYEIEVSKIMESEDEENRKKIEENIKQQVLADPEKAKSVLGEEEANKLKDHVEKEKEKVYEKNIEKQEKIADSEFAKKYTEYKDAGEDETREARRKAEIQEAIHKAIGEIYSEKKQEEEKQKGKSREEKIKSYEEYVQRRQQMNEQFNENMQGNTPQPSASSTIHIPRSVQEQMSRNQELMDNKSTG